MAHHLIMWIDPLSMKKPLPFTYSDIFYRHWGTTHTFAQIPHIGYACGVYGEYNRDLWGDPHTYAQISQQLWTYFPIYFSPHK